MELRQPVAEDESSAREQWRHMTLRVRSSVRFRLMQRWNQEPSAGGDDAPAGSFLAKYERLGVLGEGGTAVVYLVRQRETRQLFAMKVQRAPSAQPWTRRTFNARKERYILQMLRHPFVCGLHKAFHDRSRLYLVMTFQSGGSLDDVRRFCGGRLSEKAALFYVSEIVQALEYVHTMGFVYRDLKPQNVLIASDGHVKLTDFGVAHEGLPVDPSAYIAEEMTHALANAYPSKNEAASIATETATSSCGEDWPAMLVGVVESDDEVAIDGDWSDESDEEEAEDQFIGVDDRVRLRSNSLVGTLEYMSPEMIRQTESQTTDVDWWALGCLLYELLYGVPPFQGPRGATTKMLFGRILAGKLSFPLTPRVSGTCKNLITNLLSVDPKHRLGHRRGAAEVKKHAFFREVQWALLHHNAEPPVRVRGCCDLCLIKHYQATPQTSLLPESHEEVNEDDMEWITWALKPPPTRAPELSDRVSSCCETEQRQNRLKAPPRYELPATPLTKLKSLMESLAKTSTQRGSNSTSIIDVMTSKARDALIL